LSNATDEPQIAELYDFLYRDAERIASYYAQLWNGRLLFVEESSSEAEKVENAVKGSVQVASTESKTTSDVQFASKRTIDMHDAATVDLLLRLTAQNAERTGGLGGIQVFSGTCFFVDHNILKYAAPAIDWAAAQASQAGAPPQQQHRLSRQQRRHEERTATKKTEISETGLIKQLLAVLEMPSGFILKMNEKESVCGPIKDSGLDQPISSLLFRAGSLGLADVSVIGLREKFERIEIANDSPVLQAQMQMGQTFYSLLFPATAERVIPLAIYRKVRLA
jgi:hypothetical protein